MGAGRQEALKRFGRWLGVLGPDAGSAAGRGAHWRLDYIFSIGTVSWLIHLCVALLAGVELLKADAGAWVPAWMAATTLLSLAMVALGLAFRVRPTPARPRAYETVHAALTGATGITWGVGAILCALMAPPAALTFYTLVLGGIVLGAVSSLHVMMRACMISVWTSMPLLAAAWIAKGSSWGTGSGTGSDAVSIAAMVLLFAVMLSVLALRMSDFVAQNARLADELVAKNAVLTRTSAQLAEAHEEKSRFLAQASHDLRQPIHAIGLFVECLGDLRIGRGGREVLANIDRSLESLTRLCRSLLDLSALDIGRVRPEMSAVPLGEVMGEVARQASEAARAAGVALRFRPSRLWVRSDPALLHTMIQNLVSNAIKYAPGSRVLLGVRRRNGRLAVVVADSGPGIAAADHKRIFQEFVQIRAPDAQEAEGLGLGLSIVKRLADMLGLTIGLASQPGRGAVFSIEGLAEVAADAALADRRPASRTRRLRGLRVLVVDDDRPVRTGTVQLLARWGCDVRATDRVDGQLARQCDFLLCDQELGGGESGLELIRAARAAAGRPLAAAVVTGGRTDSLADICKAESIVLLTKPVRPAQLRSVLLAGAVDQTRPSSAAIPAAAERDGTSSARSNAET